MNILSNASESKPLKPKEEKKKVERAAKRVEKQLKEEQKTHIKLGVLVLIIIDFSIMVGVLFITTSVFAILLVYAYITFVTLIALVPVMLREYERVGRKPPFLVRIFNKLLMKVLPFDRKTMGVGVSVLIIFIYLISVGGFIAIGTYIFADFITQSSSVYDYLYGSGTSTDFGFFTFISNSSSVSFIPSILFYLIVFIPVIFCFLFLISAFYYRNTQKSKILSIVIFTPAVVLLPLFLSAPSITSPSVVIGLIFIAGWGVTLLTWYRFTKRTALMSVAIMFTQVLASFLILYAFIFITNRSTALYSSDSINISTYYNPLFLAMWFGVLALIPLIIKGFDVFWSGKLRPLGVLLAVGLATIFQVYFFPLFSASIYEAYQPYGSSSIMASEVFVGFGFFFFYIYLIIIPLFFIFGYFQIGIARWLYRSGRSYGKKKNHPTVFKVLGGILATLFIVGIVFVYYFFLYGYEDYQSLYYHGISLFNGDFIGFITVDPLTLPITPKSVSELFNVTSLAITIGLFAYSSYRSAYNFALSADRIDEDVRDINHLGIFNLVLFTTPLSKKSRLIFGISLIFVFLGVTAIYAFLKIYTILFYSAFEGTLIVFGTIDSIKLGISIIGMFVAVVIFFYFLFKRQPRFPKRGLKTWQKEPDVLDE